MINETDLRIKSGLFRNDEQMIELWAKQKKRRLPFRFGYVDKEKQAHLLVTKPRPAK